MRTGYFDADGNCIAISNGGEYGDERAAFSAPVPDNLGPNTCAFKGGKVVEKNKPPRPVPELGPSLLERVVALEDEVKKLKEKK